MGRERSSVKHDTTSNLNLKPPSDGPGAAEQIAFSSDGPGRLRIVRHVIQPCPVRYCINNVFLLEPL